jgi:hypothetical protein
MIQTQNALRQLRLSGLLQSLEVRLQEAAASRLSHGEFLEIILQDELQVRQQAPSLPAHQSRRLPRPQKPRRLRLAI